MRNAKVDVTHAAVVETLRKCGWLVIDTHRLPGFVDAVAFKKAAGVHLVEIKRDKKAPLTPGQVRLIELGWPLVILWDVESVIHFNERVMGWR